MNFTKFIPKIIYSSEPSDKKQKRKRRTKEEMQQARLLNNEFVYNSEEGSAMPITMPNEVEEEKEIYSGPKHWKLAATTVVNPHPMSVQNDPVVTRLSFTGKTTYLFVCEETGEFKKEEVEGVEPTDLDSLVLKVEASGPEYVVRQTGTYILMKKPQDTLPVR